MMLVSKNALQIQAKIDHELAAKEEELNRIRSELAEAIEAKRGQWTTTP